MNRTFILLVAVALLFSQLYAETLVSGPISTTAWTLEDSPYILTADVEVMANHTLYIEPGVEVLGHQETVLWVSGTLIAIGTEEQQILFSRVSEGVLWDGIRIYQAGKPSVFEWCIFEYASTFHNHMHGGAINLGGSTASFRYCLFQHNQSDENSSGIYSNNAHATIEYCVFRWNDAGGSGVIGTDVGGTMNIRYSVFYENIADAAPVGTFYPCTVTLDHLTIANNLSRLPYYSACFFSPQPITMTNSIVQIPQQGSYSNTQYPFQQYACIWGPGYDEDTIPGSNLIVADPMFSNPDALDFRLLPNSPCIDAGDPSFPFDADGTRTDLGALPVYGDGFQPDHVLIPDLPAIAGHVASIPFVANFTPDAHIIGVQGQIQLPMEIIASIESIRLNPVSPFNLDGWTISHNLIGDTLHVALAGNHTIAGNAPLVFIDVMLNNDAPIGEYPVTILEMMVNEGDPVLTWESGSLNVIDGVIGDASLNGVVQAFDAGLILSHLAERIELSGVGYALSDVSGNGEVGTEDASLILHYVTGLIEGFPAQGLQLPTGSGDLVLNQESDPGEPVCQVTCQLLDAESIRSGSLTLHYPRQYLDLNQIEMMSGLDGFVEFVQTSYGADIFLASSQEITSSSIGWIRLNFTVASNSPQSLGIQRIGGSLNDYVTLDDTQELTLQLGTNHAPENELPVDFLLMDVYPNPFNPSTTIHLELGDSKTVRVDIFDMLGRKVVHLYDGRLSTGSHSFIWNASGIASGVYLLSVEADGMRHTRKLTLLH